jgi:hypothetical protein
MRRIVLPVALLAVLFVATAAPGGRGGFSGGFGGGRGGFGGGFSRSPGSSYGGGIRSRSYGGGWGGYFGPRFIFFGGRGIGWPVILVVAGGIALVAGGLAFKNWLDTRYALVSLGLNLRRGERYARKLDDLVADSDFTTPAGRSRALHRLAKMIEPEDIADGYITTPKRFGDRNAVGQTAEQVARAQMQRIGIHPEAVNVANAEGQSVRVDAPETSPDGARGNACVVAVLATVRRNALNGLNPGGEKEALRALQTLYETTGQSLDAVYFYYAPNAAEPLDPVSANRLFLDLRATAVES